MSTNNASEYIFKNQFLKTGIESLFLNAETADVNFAFTSKGKCERVPAHKCLLAAGSEVFKRMLFGDCDSKENDVITVDDTPFAAFKEFLQFFYLIEVKLTMKHVVNVVNLGKKYNAIACLSICERFLKDIIASDTICFVYGLAILFDLEHLKDLCESRISANPEALFASSAFLKCHRSVLSHILNLEQLSCSETKVFLACMAWVQATSKENQVTKELVRAHLGELFYDIRFGSMTINEFVAVSVSYDDLFSSNEYKEIVQLIVAKEFQSNKFKRNSRQTQPEMQVTWNKDAVIECGRVVEDQNPIASYCILQAVETTTFTTNKPVILGEFYCTDLIIQGEAGSRNALTTEVSITEIFDKDHQTVVRAGKGTLGNELISLRPVLIRPGFMYEIQFKQMPNKHFYRAKELKDEVEFDTDIVIQFHGISSNSGLIKTLRFNRLVNDT